MEVAIDTAKCQCVHARLNVVQPIAQARIL
jgi:hypothetical protein